MGNIGVEDGVNTLWGRDGFPFISSCVENMKPFQNLDTKPLMPTSGSTPASNDLGATGIEVDTKTRFPLVNEGRVKRPNFRIPREEPIFSPLHTIPKPESTS